MEPIITLTMNPSIDTNTKVEHVVANKKLRCDKASHEPGGGGINVSRALKILGGSSTAIWSMGGWYGDMLKSLIEEEGIDQSPNKIEQETRENFSVYEGVSDDQFRFAVPGPEHSQKEWKAVIETVKQMDPRPDFLVASGSLPPGVPEDFYCLLARELCDSNTKFILDTSGPALKKGAGKGVYLIKPNMGELKALTERDIESEEDQEEAARLLLGTGIENVMVSLGAAGVLLVTREASSRFRAPNVHIRSRIGAGDSAVAGTVLALSRGEELKNAILFGIAAGSSAVTTEGTKLCNRDQTEELYEKLKREEYAGN